MRRCFVISPIGDENSETREHADDVFDYIVKPAMEECGLEALRADDLRAPGVITDQMLREILEADLCIAVLTGTDPTVHYKLAVAQCAARPVIILTHRGEELPFDIRDLRCVTYDLKPRPLFDRIYSDEIVAHVRSVERAGWQAPPPFGPISPLGGNADPDVRVLEKCAEFGDRRAWHRLLQETGEVFWIMGISLRAWRHSNLFGELLSRRAAAGCDIRILLAHPDNPALPVLLHNKVQSQDYEEARRNCQEMLSFYATFAREYENVAVRQIVNGCPKRCCATCICQAWRAR